jgi:hypothetical protein
MDIQKKIQNASKLLQEITAELKEIEENDNKVRFPRDYIRTTHHFTSQLEFISDDVERKNIAYHLQLSDLYSWFLNITYIAFSVNSLIIKYQLINMASIAEVWLNHLVEPNKSFDKKVDQTVKDPELKQELSWLWDKRSNIHIFLAKSKELDQYSEQDFDRSVNAIRKLIKTKI